MTVPPEMRGARERRKDAVAAIRLGEAHLAVPGDAFRADRRDDGAELHGAERFVLLRSGQQGRGFHADHPRGGLAQHLAGAKGGEAAHRVGLEGKVRQHGGNSKPASAGCRVFGG